MSRHSVILLVALLIAIGIYFDQQHLIYRGSGYLAIFFVLFCLLFNRRYWTAVAFLGIATATLLKQANNAKIALTQMPVTVLDLRITFLNPRGLFDAVKTPAWLVILWIVAGMLVLALITSLINRTILQYDLPPILQDSPLVPVRILSAAVCLFAFLFFLFNYSTAVKEYTRTSGFSWEPNGIAKSYRELGVPGFLMYSYDLQKNKSGDFFSRKVMTPAPSKKEIFEAAGRYIDLNKIHGGRPNIVVMLAESTFNVNWAFNLSRPAPNRLFEQNPYTRALGPLTVNAVGAGTWISEFESITGLDERLFGYYGYYTHSSISWSIKKTFIRYVNAKGYRTVAYYPCEGEFYNAKRGYKNYGIQEFYDSRDLGLPAGWTAKDRQIAEVVRAKSESDGRDLKGPFLKYVVLVENHAPHVCGGNNPRSLLTTFAAGASFDENCILDEFIRRADSTAAAFQTMLDYLKEVQKKTGRPFVLLIYGDHQPHTFTGKDSFYSKYDYTRYRTALDMRQTFFHLASSVPGLIHCCSGASPHLTLMPTLLSAYVADSPNDLYLDVNFYQYQQCGSDFLLQKNGGRCSQYDRLLKAYQDSGTL